MRKRAVRWIIISAVAASALFVVHEVYLKFVINDLQIALIEKRIVANYEDHAEELAELASLVELLPNFELAIGTDKSLELTISAPTVDTFGVGVPVFIQDDSIHFANQTIDIEDLAQLVNQSIVFDTVQVPRWQVDYRGKTDSPIARVLLKNRGVDSSKLSRLLELLETVDCSGITRYDYGVQILYKGHKLDNFSYYFTSRPSPNSEKNQLAEYTYWSHSQAGISCALTHWGWF